MRPIRVFYKEISGHAAAKMCNKMKYQNVEHIASGQLGAGKKIHTVFQAHLGTCVGLALWDESSKIGGLIHLLLPEPPSFSMAVFPEKYASSGIPILINKLIDLGAVPDNIQATIAGGALVGPVSRQDMNLDIGGRTTEIAVTILEAAGIKTIKSETGGFFTCTLELNMATGKTTIRPAWEAESQLSEKFHAPSLYEILKTIEKLKPIPQTALKILRMFQSGMGNIDDISSELAQDQVLSAQTLKICNSALFAGSVSIDSLKDAVLLMGEELLIKSVITAAVNNYFNQAGASGYSLCKGGLYFHAVGVATLAETIAEKSGVSNPKFAYTAGLLHDIGKVVLDQYVADSAPLFFRSIAQKDVSFLESEKKLIGITHCEAGAFLAKRWNFSDRLTNVIKHHHHPENTENNINLVYIIYLADLIIEKFSAGFDIEKMQTKSFENALTHLKLKPEDITSFVDAIPVAAFQVDDL